MSVTVTLETNTRQKIINAALTVAAREGFVRATTGQIAKTAGVSEGIIYHYFKSKHELCCDMIKEHAEEFRLKLQEQIKQAGSAREKLEKLIDFNFRYFTKKDNIFQAVYGKTGDTTIMMSQILKVAILPYVKIIEEIIKEGVKEGEFKNLESNMAASGLLGMMQLTIIRLHFEEGKFSIEHARDCIKQIFFGGLLK